MCSQQLTNHAVTCGTTYHMRYDVRVVDLSKPVSEHDRDYDLYPGHKAAMTTIRSDGEYLVTGAKNGDLKVMNFNVYKQQLSKAPNCITIQNCSST